MGFVLVLRPLSKPVLMGVPVAGFTKPSPLILKHALRFDRANGPRSFLDTSVFWYLRNAPRLHPCLCLTAHSRLLVLQYKRHDGHTIARTNDFSGTDADLHQFGGIGPQANTIN